MLKRIGYIAGSIILGVGAIVVFTLQASADDIAALKKLTKKQVTGVAATAAQTMVNGEFDGVVIANVKLFECNRLVTTDKNENDPNEATKLREKCQLHESGLLSKAAYGAKKAAFGKAVKFVALSGDQVAYTHNRDYQLVQNRSNIIAFLTAIGSDANFNLIRSFRLIRNNGVWFGGSYVTAIDPDNIADEEASGNIIDIIE